MSAATFQLSKFRYAFFVSAAVTIAADICAADELADTASDASELGSIAAESFGNKSAAKVLGKVSKVGTGISIVQNAKDGNIPGVVGNIAEAGTALLTVPGGILLGTSAAGPPGGFVGGTTGMAIAEYRGKQAEEYTRQLIEKYRDRRTDLQKRMEAVGLDYKSIADDFGNLRQVGQSARYEAEIRKRILERERQEAESRGESYIDDAFLMQEIAELERFANDAYLTQGIAEPEQFANNAQARPSTIPFATGQGIKCGPISASERRQLQNEFGVDVERLEKSIAANRSNLQSTKISYDRWIKRRGSPPPENSPTYYDYENNKRWLREARDALKSPLVTLRHQNGRCPAPIGNSSPPPTGVATPNVPPPNTAERNTNQGGAGSQAGVPAGYRRISPNACINSISDVIRC